MEMDTGAALSVIAETTRLAVFPEAILRPSKLLLKTYTDRRMEIIGTLNVQVRYCEQEQKLVLVVVAGDGPSLLGRNWLKYMSSHLLPNFRYYPKLPHTFKPHPVPVAFIEGVSWELNHLKKQGIISPVSTSQWAALIVTVRKRWETSNMR